jgi:hypothetical protein
VTAVLSMVTVQVYLNATSKLIDKLTCPGIEVWDFVDVLTYFDAIIPTIEISWQFL